MIVIGIKKKKRKEVSNRNLGAGEMVQNADSGIVWKEFHIPKNKVDLTFGMKLKIV